MANWYFISKLEARYVEPSFRTSSSLPRHFLLLYHRDGSNILSTSNHNVLMINIQKRDRRTGGNE